MGSEFEIVVKSITPPTHTRNVDDVALKFLKSIGYLPARIDPKSGAVSEKTSIAYRIFMDCFMRHHDKMWSVDEIATYLNTTKATVYRHINRLKKLDLLEETNLKSSALRAKKAYRLRYGDLKKAWNFVEAHVQVALENYRETVEHLQAIIDELGGGD